MFESVFAWSALPQPSAPVCVVAGLRVPPAWRAACVAAAGLAAAYARPSLAGAAGGSAVRGDASVWGHVQRGFIFPIFNARCAGIPPIVPAAPAPLGGPPSQSPR